MPQPHKPYIHASTFLPEVTVKAIILGFILSAILASANAYLGLFAGMTVSASIPAAVISMAVLKLFRKSNILENNIVQTAASAGESLAAGVIFTFPALVLMGYWQEFNYLETTLIALCGGVLGVCFTIPLRSALIVKQQLLFPEGVATAEVLKTGEKGGESVRFLIIGAVVGAFVKLAESGFHLWHGILDKATILQQKVFLYFGMNLSPALVAVGYIVGLRIAVLVFIGGAISWWIAIPAYIAYYEPEVTTNAVDLGYGIWNSQIRYLGAGAMLVGGVWALLSIFGSIRDAITQSFNLLKNRSGEIVEKIRTEYDTPMSWVMLVTGALIVPIFIIYWRQISDVPISLLMAILMMMAGFLFSAVAGYMAGLVGSSNNPISGVTIATILTSSLILVALMGSEAESGPAAAILIGAVVCCAAAIAGDNMQDLKAGYILGATPAKQQIMQVVGVFAAAIVMAPVLNLLNNDPSGGIGSENYPAPQASLMHSVAEGIFGGNLPWVMIGVGAGLGVLIIVADEIQRTRGSSFRIPVLAVAVGLYLPFELDSAIMLGGLVSFFVHRFFDRNKAASNYDKARFQGLQTGLLAASGLITGEALIGILIAVIVGATGSPDVLTLIENPLGTWPGMVMIGAICLGMYFMCRKAFLGYEE